MRRVLAVLIMATAIGQRLAAQTTPPGASGASGVAGAARDVRCDALVGLLVLAIVVGFLFHWRGVRRIERLEAESLTDPLTGIRNRRYLEQTIALDVASSLRAHRDARMVGHAPRHADLVFFIIDLDHFKAINDDLGHQRGDEALRAVAAALAATCRDSDLLVRWGGDEFLVVERFADRAEAATAAERFRGAVARATLTLPDGGRRPLTCSIGYASFPFTLDEPELLGWEQVVTLADLAAYAVKRATRDGAAGYVAGTLGPPRGEGWRVADLDALVRDGAVRIDRPLA